MEFVWTPILRREDNVTLSIFLVFSISKLLFHFLFYKIGVDYFCWFYFFIHIPVVDYLYKRSESTLSMIVQRAARHQNIDDINIPVSDKFITEAQKIAKRSNGKELLGGPLRRLQRHIDETLKLAKQYQIQSKINSKNSGNDSNSDDYSKFKKEELRNYCNLLKEIISRFSDTTSGKNKKKDIKKNQNILQYLWPFLPHYEKYISSLHSL